MTPSGTLRAGTVYVVLLVAAVAGGCGGESSGVNHTTLDPPANIDAVSCYDITVSDGEIGSACASCCTQQGFFASTQFENHCVCGGRRDDQGESVCADRGAAMQICMSCCENEGFTGHTWSDASNLEGTCACNGRNDSNVCKSALSAAMPSTACQICCLNSGYLGAGYTNLGAPECLCLEAY